MLTVIQYPHCVSACSVTSPLKTANNESSNLDWTAAIELDDIRSEGGVCNSL